MVGNMSNPGTQSYDRMDNMVPNETARCAAIAEFADHELPKRAMSVTKECDRMNLNWGMYCQTMVCYSETAEYK